MNNKKNKISTRRSQLSPAKQAILEKRLRGECKSDNQEKFIPRRSQQNPVPLSFAQQRLWFLAQLEPDSSFYNVPGVVRLQGQLNFEALQDSLQKIINRHEALRCNFQIVEDKPVALIFPTKSLLVPIFDISELPANLQAAEVKKLAYQEAQQPFDLSSDLLLRAKLVRLNAEEHILLFTMHHIVSDGWSIGVLVHELATLYQVFGNGQSLPLPELPIQYGDFAIWQQDYLQGEVLTTQKNYWKQQLGGALPVLQLPTDYPRPAVQSYKGNKHCFTVSKSLTTALKNLSQQAAATLFMTLLAAFKTLIYRYINEDDIIIGTAIANRNLPQIETLIGFFVNTLVLRTDVSGNPSFLDLLARIKEVTLDAYNNQDLPFEKLVEEIQPERNLSHNPLFQVWFALNNSPMPSLEMGGLTLTISEADSATAQFDLSLDMVEQQEELIGTFEYSSDLFDADTITRLAEHFQTLLVGIIANPEQQIASLPLLTKAEENNLLWKWNNNQVEYPQNQCIHQLFENCANKTPNSVSVVFQQQRLTYQELNSKANQLAHYLRSLGVKKNVLVGICLERSVEMIIALLGVLKAGGAYVPLDPAYPEERLSFMLRDSQVSVLLTQQKLVASLPVENIPVVCLDRDWEIISQQSEVNPATNSTSDNLAYVIYTSGSTGKSKGVAIAHRSLVNAFYAWAKAYQLDALNSHLQMASFAFDVFSGDLIRALCSGAKLVLCPREWLLEAGKLYQLMLVEQVDSAEFVPVVLRNLVQYLEKTRQNLHFMRLLVVGSDSLYINEYQEFQHFCGEQTRLINSYGVTEATIDSTYFEATKFNLSGNGLVPIGRPLANTEIYILDCYLQPVPVGIAGELYIGGVGLAQYYLNRPDLTKEKFILWNGEKRLYKTGDKAKYLADGNIEFLGRLDYQIKLRGFRIELGEIEAVIKQHPSVDEAVVIAREDVSGDRRMVAYFVENFQFDKTNKQQLPAPIKTDLQAPLQENQHRQLASDLREFLEQKLPDYMIPAAFLRLEALPITPNGKLDRRALPAPEATQLLSQSDFIAPSTPIEQMLVKIWTEVLGIENIGIHHNFFSLGGHSLLATRLLSQIRQVFQIEIPLRRIFEKPTIAGLARDIEKAPKADLIEATSIKRIARSQNLPLSFAQQRFWFLAQLELHSSSYNMPGAVRLHGQLNVEALQQSFNEILRRHEALRTNFQTIEGQPIAVILPPLPVQLPILDISELPANQQELQVQQQALTEAQQPFDLNDGFLLRVKLLRLGEEHVVFLTMHHIASDAWSTDILVREFATLYQAFCDGQPAPLAELPIQYVDFAAWQRQWLQGERLESQISYWRKQLEGIPELLELPTDFPRPPVQTFRGATYAFELPQQLSVALNQLSQQQGTTLFMTLLAAFQTLLYRYTGSEDIAIGSPIGNRNQTELEGLIGLFVNTLVLRTNLAGNPTFEQLLTNVRSVALSAYAHQDLPFELLVEELQPQRNLSHTPLFQVMFVLQNAPMSALELPGLTLTYLPIDNGTAKFDLTLDMTETAEGLHGAFEYNTDLFQQSTIKRMAGHLQRLLEAIVANPQQRISQLPLLTESEQHQLLREWNNPIVVYPTDKCLHQLFVAQVERTPDAIAVVYEHQQLTYSQLNAKANQLAHYLRSLGVKPEVLVGICVDKSLDMVTCLLAILKAGGAYVPLDPAYPKQRLADMLEDSQPGVLLTQQNLVESLPPQSSQVICIDRNWELIADQNTENPVNNTTIDNLAYVIYTSGSTGKPKGAMNSHRGICNRLLWMQDAYQLTAADSVLQKTPFSFDVSVWEFFWTLITGGRLVVAQPEGHKDPNYLVNLIYEQQITTLHFVPSMLQVFLESENVEKCQSIKRVIASGEALPVQLQKRFFNRLDAQLHNLYGPTEAAVDVTFWQCQDNTTTQNTVPIGHPIANIQIYLLDKYLNLVPVGVTGEIYIGGVGVGRGYLNRPELTAEKFIPNSFSDEPSARLYKTGDLARYLANGEIEYIGRIDNQVKIRGFRIELGEIEVAIAQYPGVRETVVTVWKSADSQRIVAYLVPQIDQTLTISQLRQFLESKLPNYMIPAAFLILEALPLTPNGKVDRKALSEPNTSRLEPESNFVLPRSPVEETLAQIWSQVLGLKSVGVYDNFFELGGDSILSLQIIAQANQVGIKLTPKQMFQHQTIAQLATVASTNQATTAKQDVVIGTLPLTPIQHWFFEQHFQEAHHWNQAVLLEVRQLDAVVLEKAIQHLLVHHDALRLRFQQNQSGVQQFNAAPEKSVVLTKVDLSGQSDAEHTMIEAAANRLQVSLNLAQGTLLGVILFDLGRTKPSRLLIVIHHLAVDGVSWRILLEDLQTAYQQLSVGEAPHLPPKTTSFQDWAKQLREYANSETLQSELNYWLTKSPMQICNLPVDFLGNNTEASADTVSFSLTPEETQALLQQVPQAYNTQINDVLLTALVLAFTSWTGNRHLLVDLEGHGREEIFENVDLSRTVGWFTTIFPVLLNIESTDDLGENLKSVKEQLRQIPNRGIGYGLLRYLSCDRIISAQLQQCPQAEVIFNYLGQVDQVLSSSLFQPATESSGSNSSLKENRSYLLEVDALVVASQLQLTWKYSQNIHQTSTIEKLALNFVQVLRSLIAHCQSLKARAYTPSDFPLAKLDWQTLNRLIDSKQEIEDIYPLSPVQYGMLFHLLYAPKSSAYLYQVSCTLQGNLNFWAFEQAWNQVIERHPILRTAFVWEIDIPLQIVLPQANLCLQRQDWQNLSAFEQQNRLEEFLQADLERGFDLVQAPLIRLTLIQVSPDTYQLIWNCHHLLLDGWSIPLLLKEVFSSYKALCSSQQIQIPASRPYRHYIAWLQQQNLRSAETYWRQALAGVCTPTPLPLKQTFEKLSAEESNYYEQEIRLSPETTNTLVSLTRQYKLTLNTLMQGIWALLLGHYSGETDVVFGATVSGRPPTLAAAESMIGMFINTIPVRVKLSKADLFVSWSTQIQHSQVEARQYEYSPLVKIQEWSEIPRGLPLFNSIVVFENYPVDTSLQPEIGLDIKNIRSWSRNHYPLTLRVVPGLELSVQILWMSETNFERVNAGAIARITQHLKILLSEIGKNPHLHIQELLEMLTEIDLQQQLIQKSELQATERQKLKMTKRKAIRDI